MGLRLKECKRNQLDNVHLCGEIYILPPILFYFNFLFLYLI